MNTEQTHVAIDATVNNQETAEQPLQDEKQESRKYYLRQLQQMCPTMSLDDKSDNSRLLILKRRTERLVEMLTLFEHSWTEEIPALQKACMTYLATEILPRKERQRVIDAWSEWSDFQFQLARYRGLLTQFLQYHHRIGNELASLLRPADTETSPGLQENNQKGGI